MIVEYSLMTTTLSGIDNSDALLPTLPCGPGEDTFFGELVRFVYPATTLCEMPWMLHHQPERPRSWTRRQASTTGGSPGRRRANSAARHC